MNHLVTILDNNYNIQPNSIEQKQGGWSALAYKITDNENTYFLKVYEKNRASTAKLTAQIDQYCPILTWLDANSELSGRIPVPLLTNNDSSYKCEDNDHVYMLYRYIDGETIGEKDLSISQRDEFSQMISELHSFVNEIPVETKLIAEDYEVLFLDQLEMIIDSSKENLPEQLYDLISSNKQHIQSFIRQIKDLSLELKESQLNLALCHTDLHNWNLMQAHHLILIDWEGLKLAPVEADLMFLVDQPYFNNFLKSYQQKHPNYTINDNALKFYQIKRMLEDTWEFIEQLLYEELDAQAITKTFLYLQEIMEKMKSKV